MGWTILLAISGFSAGTVVAGGIFALIVGLKIVPRFAGFTHTAHLMMLYESCIVWGGIVGNIVNVFQIPLYCGAAGLLLFGLVGGIYVGAWAMALALICTGSATATGGKLDALPALRRKAQNATSPAASAHSSNVASLTRQGADTRVGLNAIVTIGPL